MTQLIRSAMAVFGVVFLLMVVAAPVEAASFVVPTDRFLVQQADAVVVGTALTSYTQLATSGNIETITEFSVEEVIKGTVSTSTTLKVHTPGGMFGDRIEKIFGAPSFRDGDRHLLLLHSTNEKNWTVLDFILGKFAFGRDIRGRSLLLREEGEVFGWDAGSGAPHVETRREATRFLQFVRDVASGSPALENYRVPTEALRVQDQALVAPVAPTSAFLPSTYTMDCGGGVGCRWGAFPTAVSWVNKNTESGAPNGGLDAIRAGLNAWTNECASNVNYVYGGQDSAANNTWDPDGRNSIAFDVSIGQPPFSCGSGGVIAVGGITTASGTHTHPVSGENFFTTREGDVRGNLGLSGCTSFLTSGSFTTAMVHELGHTLSFRHSNQDRNGAGCPGTIECSSGAIMNSSVVGGLNGVLQTWDINAVQSLYPGGSCGGSARALADFDADVRSDISIFRPGEGGWYIRSSTSGNTTVIPNWGLGANDVPVPGDYDGDRRTDAAVFRPGTGEWFIRQSSNGSMLYIPNWGLGANDMPVAADYDGDGRTDVAVFRPTSGEWFIRQSTNTALFYVPNFGISSGDVPVPADYDGDGKADVAIFRPIRGDWFIRRSTDGGMTFVPNWGPLSNDRPVPADYDGDGRADVAVFRSGEGGWYVRRSSNGQMQFTGNWGMGANDIPAPADYDGDGKADVAVFRPIEGGWYIRGSAGSNTILTNFGPRGNDKPVPRFAH